MSIALQQAFGQQIRNMEKLQNYSFKSRNVDVVYCIDGTGSMYCCIDNVKDNVRRLYDELMQELQQQQVEVTGLRVRFIIFRDFKCDGESAMEQSRFFELPDEEFEMMQFLDDIEADGGCSEDANGLEALYLAMNSDWVQGADDRQVIVLCADTDAIPLAHRERKCSRYYPSPMAKNMDELEGVWFGQYRSKLGQRNKRLVMFAPAFWEEQRPTVYNTLGTRLDASMFVPVEIHGGLSDISFEEIVRMLAASISSD